MRHLILYCLLLVHSTFSVQLLAQNPHTSRLKQSLAQATTDTARILRMADISASYRYSQPDSALWYARRGAKLSEQLRYAKGEGRCLTQLGISLSEKGDLAGALSELLHAQGLNRLAQDQLGLAQSLQAIGYLYITFPDFRQARMYLFRAKALYDSTHIIDSDAVLTVANLGYAYRYQNQVSQARHYQQMAYQLAMKLPRASHSAWGDPLPFVLRELGLLADKNGQAELGIRYLNQAKAAALTDNNRQAYTRTCNSLATIFRQKNQLDSALYYTRQALTTAQQIGLTMGLLKNSQLAAQLFKANRQPDSALKYTELMLVANDSLYNQQRIKQLESINFEEQQRRRRIEEKQARFETQVQTFALLSGVAVLIIISLILWRNYRRQRQVNTQLNTLNEQVSRQNEEITHQRDDLSNTLADLRTTQTQLVQAEKMASLGELTAGIAHEIQNPLNFVNNFSEVSTELVTELEEEQQKPDRDIALETEILGDLKQNLQKITHHGGRASAIVRGMLEHARTSTGEKRPTDLNALMDEYLKLAYHGLRAKDTTFNCALITEFDSTLPPIEIMPQEIGRVLLNLYNNAFYAVHQKQKMALADYQPTVGIRTRYLKGCVEIRVRDNGTGIPDLVKAKIFQPFFTTKPTGEGTGLGLSLSYDIITKGYDGTLSVESIEGQGSEFVLTLPHT